MRIEDRETIEIEEDEEWCIYLAMAGFGVLTSVTGDGMVAGSSSSVSCSAQTAGVSGECGLVSGGAGAGLSLMSTCGGDDGVSSLG